MMRWIPLVLLVVIYTWLIVVLRFFLMWLGAPHWVSWVVSGVLAGVAGWVCFDVVEEYRYGDRDRKREG